MAGECCPVIKEHTTRCFVQCFDWKMIMNEKLLFMSCFYLSPGDLTTVNE